MLHKHTDCAATFPGASLCGIASAVFPACCLSGGGGGIYKFNQFGIDKKQATINGMDKTVKSVFIRGEASYLMS